jgi:hypothetical protein
MLSALAADCEAANMPYAAGDKLIAKGSPEQIAKISRWLTVRHS